MSHDFTARQISILMYLMEQRNYITGNKLAQHFKLSDKTVRNEIKVLQGYVTNYGGEISSVSSHGYLLIIQDQNNFEVFKKQLIKNGAAPNNPIERGYYIIAYLLRRTEPIKIEELSEMLFIERTSVSRDLKYVRECLERFSLNLQVIPKQGILITGSEFHWRLCMSEFMFHKPHQITSALEMNIACKEKIEACLQRDGIVLSHMSFQNLLIHMQVQMDRCSLHPIDIDQEDRGRLRSHYEFLVALDLAKIMKEHYDITLSKDECCYLAIHLLGKRINSISAIESCISDTLRPEVEQMLTTIFVHIEKEFHIDFKEDIYLRKALGMHIIPMLDRLKFHTYLRNPMLYEIKQKYMLACFIAREILQLLLFANYQYVNLDDEIAYIALHIQYAMERKKRTLNKKRVLVINDHSGAATELLNFYLLKRFDEVMDLKGTIYSRDLHKYNIDDFDLIITTVPIQLQCKAEVVKISPILTFEQLEQLEPYFVQRIHLLAKDYFHIDKKAETMVFRDAFQIMNYLYDEIVCKERKVEKDVFLLQEKYGSSELDNMIALPYAFHEGKTEITVIYLRKPIIYSNKMVKTVLFLNLSKSENLVIFFEHLGKWIHEQTWLL